MYIFLLSLVLYLPFQIALNPVAGVDLASIRVIILIFFGIWLAQGLKNKKLQIKNNIQTWLVASFLFFNGLSLVVAKNPDWSMRKLLFLLSIFPIYFVSSQIAFNKERILKIISAIVFSATAIAIVGITQFSLQFLIGVEVVYAFWAKYLTVPFLGNAFGGAVLKNPSWLVNIDGQTYLRATSLFPDPHMLAFYLGLALPLAASLIIKNKKINGPAILACSAILLADVLTFSRGGYLGLFAGLIFAILVSWQKLNKKHKLATNLFFVISIALIVVPSPFSQRFASSFNFKEGSNQGRIAMWQKAGEVALDNPFLGVGIGNYPLEVKPTASYRDPIYAHNVYLDIAAETGILNMFVWLAIVGIAFWSFWKKGKQEKLFFFTAASVVIFSAHSLVETAIYSPVVLTLFLIIISLSNLNLQYEENI